MGISDITLSVHPVSSQYIPNFIQQKKNYNSSKYESKYLNKISPPHSFSKYLYIYYLWLHVWLTKESCSWLSKGI